MIYLDQTELSPEQTYAFVHRPANLSQNVYDVDLDGLGENAAEQVLMHNHVFVVNKFCSICNDFYRIVSIIYK